MTLTAHPLAEKFPMISEPELRELAEDIRQNGQRDPIITLNGKILDGRNRAAACDFAKIPVRTQELGKDQDPLKFVLSKNLFRRNLTESQRALIVAENTTGTSAGSTTQVAAAELAGVSVRTIRDAQKVQAEASPSVKKKVRDGKLSVKKAASTLNPKATKSEYDKTVLDRISKVIGPKVSSSVRDGILANVPPKEALAWTKLNDRDMAEVESLVVQGRWEPSKAHRFLQRMPDEKTTVLDLINLAIAKDGEFEATINGYTVTIKGRKK